MGPPQGERSQLPSGARLVRASSDVVLVSAAFPSAPAPLAVQVAIRGRLVQPIAKGGAHDVVMFERSRRGLERRSVITRARFVRLDGKDAYR
jgi:protein-L-isoaspartate(D-aspartate) O-methyltransferase